MDGVTILQTIPQYVPSWGWSAEVAIFGGIALALFAAIIVLWARGDNTGACVCLISFLLAGGLTVGMAGISGERFTHNRYQVLIDESVSMTEFTEKYDVIEQQGITYIVEEKVTE